MHRLQGRHHNRRIRKDGDIAGHNARTPAPGAPLGEFVIGESSRGHGKKRPAGEIRLFQPPLKNVGLPRPSRGINHDVAPSLERLNGLSLPAVWQHQLLQALQCINAHITDRRKEPTAVNRQMSLNR